MTTNNITPITLDLYSWNVNGVQDALKSRNIRQQMYDHKGVYLLQETHYLSVRDIQRFNTAAPICYQTNGLPNRNGVLLSIPQRNQNLTHIPSSINSGDGNGRLLMININWLGLPILLVNIYAPPSTPSERALFFDQIHSRLLNETLPIIMAGDFNCWMHPLDHHTNSNPANTADINSLNSLLNSLNLVDIWREYNPTGSRRTYGPLASKISRIDKFYVSESLMPLIPPEFCTIIPSPISDHSICKISLLAPNGETIHKSQWRFNARLLKSDNFKSCISGAIARFQQLIPGTSCPDEVYFKWYGQPKGSLSPIRDRP